MDPRLDEILRQVSQPSILALRELIQLNVRAAMTQGYHAVTSEESKRIRDVLRAVPDADLGVLVFKLDATFGPLRTFFATEGQKRRGDILEWVFRGMLPDHTPDILTLTLVREPLP